MSLLEPSPSPWTGRMLSVFRIVIGLLFMEIGTFKLFGFPPFPYPPMTIPILSELGAAGFLETFGGLAIVLGLATRPVAFILAGEMAVAYWQFHFPNSPLPSMNGGQDAVLFCFIYLYLMFAGGGTWSLDAVIASRRRASLQGPRETGPAKES